MQAEQTAAAGRSSGADGLAGTLLEIGALSNQAWPVAALKPHLQGLLGAVCSREAEQGDSR